jgi:replication factor C small subunit
MKDLIWYERHRPDGLKQMVLTPDYRTIFKKFIKDKEIPHLLFHGPAGSGKTTLAQILINRCAGRSLILNASSEDRGIAIIKTRVRQFATAKHSSKLNVVFFDEANGLTGDAQEALKNTIEKYQRNCRFIFTTNEFDKITEPIVSRCQVFKFDSFPKKRLYKKLHGILEDEDIEYKEKQVKKIVERYYPDIRTIINTLQSCSATGKLNLKLALGFADPKLMTTYLNEGKAFALRNMLAGSQDYLWVYRFLFDEYIPKEMDHEQVMEACIVVADYMWRDRSVVDKEINIAACFMELMSLNEVDIDFEEPF